MQRGENFTLCQYSLILVTRHSTQVNSVWLLLYTCYGGSSYRNAG